MMHSLNIKGLDKSENRTTKINDYSFLRIFEEEESKEVLLNVDQLQSKTDKFIDNLSEGLIEDYENHIFRAEKIFRDIKQGLKSESFQSKFTNFTERSKTRFKIMHDLILVYKLLKDSKTIDSIIKSVPNFTYKMSDWFMTLNKGITFSISFLDILSIVLKIMNLLGNYTEIYMVDINKDKIIDNFIFGIKSTFKKTDSDENQSETSLIRRMKVVVVEEIGSILQKILIDLKDNKLEIGQTKIFNELCKVVENNEMPVSFFSPQFPFR